MQEGGWPVEVKEDRRKRRRRRRFFTPSSLYCSTFDDGWMDDGRAEVWSNQVWMNGRMTERRSRGGVTTGEDEGEKAGRTDLTLFVLTLKIQTSPVVLKSPAEESRLGG